MNTSSLLSSPSKTSWRMPIVPQAYDRSPLTSEEQWALAHFQETSLVANGARNSRSKASRTARHVLARFDLPLRDIFRLRHRGRSEPAVLDILRTMRHEMHRYQKTFRDWSPDEWRETLCSTPTLFKSRYGKASSVRTTIIDAAYLLGEVADLQSIGIGLQISLAADTYFGRERMAQQSQRLLDALAKKGYADGGERAQEVRQCLSMIFVLNRSPHFEDITEELLASVEVGRHSLQHIWNKVIVGLQALNIISRAPRESDGDPHRFDGSGMAREWFLWCTAWYEQCVDLTPGVRQDYVYHLLAVGRWLHEHAPDIHTPEHWTEELALFFRRDLCSWTGGQYGSSKGRQILSHKGELGKPLKAQAIDHYLSAMRRYFSDLMKRPHTIDNTLARRIKLDFVPQDAFQAPAPIRHALDAADPRDVDLQVWAKLVIAAATLAKTDLRQGQPIH
jgi:hypothetical protein